MMLIIGAALKGMCGFIFDNPIGKAVAGAALVLAVFFLWLWRHDVKVAAAATTEIVTSLNDDAEKKANEAVKARAPALRAGAAQRLRDATNCRDCLE